MRAAAVWVQERIGGRALATTLVLALALAAPAATQYEEGADAPEGPPPTRVPKRLGQRAPRLAGTE